MFKKNKILIAGNKKMETRLPVRDRIIPRTLDVLTQPIRSGLDYGLHKVTRGKYKADLELYFGPHEHKSEIDKGLHDTAQVLTDIDEKLAGGSEFIGDKFEVWKKVKTELEDHVGLKITDQVLIDRKGGNHVLFAEKDDKIVPIFLSGVSTEGDTRSLFGIGNEYPKEANTSENVARELTIFKIMEAEALEPENYKLRKVDSVANDFELRRHALFEREGDEFEAIRAQGALSIGELQTVSRLLLFGGITFEEGEVRTSPSLEDIWIKTRMISMGENVDTKTAQAVAQKEIAQFAKEVVYFRLAQQYFVEHPDVTREFMKSEYYLQHRKDFINSHLAARGQTEEKIAEAMLANYCLARFEKTDIENSPSQKYIKDKEGFMGDIDNFLTGLGVFVPGEIRDLATELKGALVNKVISYNQRYVALAEAKRSLEKVANEIWRHKETRKIFDRLVQLSPFDFVDDKEKPVKVFRVIIGNLGLAKVPGEGKFTMSSYLPKVPYYPEGSEVLPFDPEKARHAKIIDSIKCIFDGSVLPPSGSGEKASAYESQVTRIYTEGTTILRFLTEDPRIPDNVREFVQAITSDNLGQKILERYGPVSDQDPQIVNRFFKDGFDRFQTMITHRYVTDFVRGVETNLILLTGGTGDKVSRQFMGDWKNFDFSQLPDEVVDKAIEMTLADGKHRLELLNHETSERTTLKDKQELLEKVFGWNTYDMWFLRWEKFWNVWNTLGGAWDCICFMRKPIFNPGTIKQF
ncbi:MAG: hypothetical protein HYV90_02455 [Candidatus Woesebacteria bacterium]|nr:MAG: hypothetical protein HYV90_02455 [Candidatus Woesebacteria bacterium]